MFWRRLRRADFSFGRPRYDQCLARQQPKPQPMNPEIPPSYFFDRAPLKVIVERAASALRARIGFSLVRLGDGEGPMICWPDFQSPDEMAVTLRTWFGRSDFADSDLAMIANGLRQATRSADILGLPTRYQLTRTPRYGMVLQGIDHYGLYSAHQTLSDSGLHWYLQWSGALAQLLRGLNTIGVIGCRDIGSQIATTFGVGSVQTYLVRGEHCFPGSESRTHWPDGFAEVMRRLDAVRPGDVFLVGAGVLGKIYCDQIKTRGGVALDIGSLLDSWANIPSRDRYELGSPAFTLEHFKSVGRDWKQMIAALDRCAKELHARDATITY
jgi:hypothetical protein